MPDTIPVGKYYNFDNKNVDVVYNPDENSGTKNITILQNGTRTANVENYASVSISTNVQPSKIIDRTGKLSTIIGTGDEFNAFNSALRSRNIFAFVDYEFSGVPVGMALMSVNSNDIIGMAFKTDGTMANTMGVVIGWNIAGNVTAIALMGGQLQDLSSYAPMIDANLTVYGTTPIGG